MPRQLFNILVEYPHNKEVTIVEVKTHLEQVLKTKVDKFIGFTSSSLERDLSGPAIRGHLIIEHAQAMDAETLLGHLVGSNGLLAIHQIKKL